MASVRQPIPADAQVPAPSTAAETPAAAPESEAAQIQRAIDIRFEGLLRHVQANRPSEDVSLIRKAWEFCVKHHAGQMRASGEPYIIHPLEVAEVLAEM
jgi:GTP pyrophosphokinase